MSATSWDQSLSQPQTRTLPFRLSAPALARIAGALYLILAICGGFSELVVRSGVKVAGDAAATAENIRASAGLFRLSFVLDLTNITCFVLLAMTLYVLLSPVNRTIAASFVIFNAVAVAIMGANLINHAGALAVATNATISTALGAGPADGLASLFLELHSRGYEVGQVFFGLWLLPLGYLVYVSGYFPRLLGVLPMIGCAGYLAHLGAIYLSPNFQSDASLYLAMLAGVTEFAFLLWLLVKGIDIPSGDRAAASPTRA